MSLVELIMVVSIIGVLASVAALRFNGSTEAAQLQHATDQLMSDLRLVRDQARSDQQSYTLSFNTGLCTYDAPGVSDLNRPTDLDVSLSQAPFKISSIICDFVGPKLVTFDAQGNPSTVGNIILERDSKQTTIRIMKNGRIEQVNPSN